MVSLGSCPKVGSSTYVATGEVSTLEHEIRDHTVKLGALVAEALLTSAKSAEVLRGLGDDIIEKLEVDATALICRKCYTLAIDSNEWREH
jgi:hypothetical protein